MNEIATLSPEIPRTARALDEGSGNSARGINVPRVLGRIDGPEPGPTLIIVGGLHGNEPAGVLALERVLPRLAASADVLRGLVVGLAGNRKALKARRRYLEHDLNRFWSPERVAELRSRSGPFAAEEEELVELDCEIERLHREAEGDVYLLDLHTTSGPELPFATLDDALANRAFAFAFPVPVVLGLEEELAGTLTSHVEAMGIITAGFESGQHDAPQAVERAEAAIWIALETAGLIEDGDRSEVTSAYRRLSEESAGLPHVVEVRYRHAIEPDHWFRMDPGYANFEALDEGQSLGMDRHGAVSSPMSGLILMPLYQEQGADGFFVVRSVAGVWLKLSAVLRRGHIERFIHLLPGIRRHPETFGSFIVDMRYARWGALELFHLLGFRRESRDNRYLVMTPRYRDE